MVKKGKIIAVTSTKGGVGKTTTLLNLAGIYSIYKKKVLIIDLDLYAGGVSLCLNLNVNKTVYNIVDDMANNRFNNINDYIINYDENISVISCPKDPRQAFKIDSKYIDLILYNVENKFDVVLIDTNHVLDSNNLTIMDRSYYNLFVVANDPVCLKNTKSMISIFKDNDIDNYKILYNNSRDTGVEEYSLYEIKTIIKAPINYTITKNFYIKDIDSYTVNGKILIMDKKIQKHKSKDFSNFKNMAVDLIKDKKGDKDGKENTK